MPQMSLGNGYTIDLADGWTFVHALQDAQEQLRTGYAKNVAGMVIHPPGNDGHSGEFASSMTKAAVTAHENWYKDRVNQLGTMIDNVMGILHQYGIAETANTIKWADAPTYDPNDNTDVRRGHGAV